MNATSPNVGERVGAAGSPKPSPAGSTPATYASGGRSFPDDHLTDAELAELLAARAVDEARGLRG